MAKPLNELRERLLRAGVAPRHVRRYLTELADHLADLRAEEERAGRSRVDAESAALARLGRMDDLAKAMMFGDAVPYTDTIRGNSGFDTWFQKQAIKDPQGHSLRDFDRPEDRQHRPTGPLGPALRGVRRTWR